MNGRSQGRRSKREKLMLGSYRLVWPDVRYEAGTLKAVAYDGQGHVIAETVVNTAGSPVAIELVADRKTMVADGDDMAFVTVRLVDADGNLCPTADDLVTFQLDGPATIAAVDNGNAASLESFQANQRRAFSGLCMVYLRSAGQQDGVVTLTATADGLASASVTLETQSLNHDGTARA